MGGWSSFPPREWRAPDAARRPNPVRNAPRVVRNLGRRAPAGEALPVAASGGACRVLSVPVTPRARPASSACGGGRGGEGRQTLSPDPPGLVAHRTQRGTGVEARCVRSLHAGCLGRRVGEDAGRDPPDGNVGRDDRRTLRTPGPRLGSRALADLRERRNPRTCGGFL